MIPLKLLPKYEIIGVADTQTLCRLIFGRQYFLKTAGNEALPLTDAKAAQWLTAHTPAPPINLALSEREQEIMKGMGT